MRNRAAQRAIQAGASPQDVAARFGVSLAEAEAAAAAVASAPPPEAEPVSVPLYVDDLGPLPAPSLTPAEVAAGFTSDDLPGLIERGRRSDQLIYEAQQLLAARDYVNSKVIDGETLTAEWVEWRKTVRRFRNGEWTEAEFADGLPPEPQRWVEG